MRFVVVLLTCLWLWPALAEAQMAFTPLQEGEFEQKDDLKDPPANLTLHGFYEAGYFLPRESYWGNSLAPATSRQEMLLAIRSTFNENLSLNAHISNQKTLLNDQRLGYMSERESEWGTSREADGMTLHFKEAYLEYNHNPNAVLKLGYQAANPADGMGLVYQGIGSGITQRCRMGTWCYYIGALKLDTPENNTLFWGQLDYPIFETGVTTQDPWMGKRQVSSLNVEVFRVFYNGNHIPLSRYEGWVAPYSDAHLQNENGKYISFDQRKTEYVGFNLKWNYYAFQLHQNLITLHSTRNFYAVDANSDDRNFYPKRIKGGILRRSDIFTHLGEGWRWRLERLDSPGTDHDTPAEEEWWKEDSKGYSEVQKGFFGDALIYLNGLDLSGDGHSVNNLEYWRSGFDYATDRNDFRAKLDWYQFNYNKSVFNDQNRRISKVGHEYDLVLSWNLEKPLVIEAWGAYFVPDGGYAPTDFAAPRLSEQNSFSRWGAHLKYSF